MINVEEIIAKEILGENDWRQISKETLTLDQMKLFKDKLYWNVIMRNQEDIDNKFIDELIEEGIIKYDIDNCFSTGMFRDISERHVNEVWFAKKYKEYFKIENVARRKKFKRSELVEIFGKPQVGTGVTYAIGTDAYPFTVIESKPKGLTILIQEDNATPTESHNYFGNQDYIYSPNPNGRIIELKLNAQGRWKSGNYGTASIGKRRKYQDPSF